MQSIKEIHSHNINLATREIYLHSTFDVSDEGAEPGVEYRQSNIFIKNMHILDQPPFDPILIFIHSDGGSWEEGMAMFNTIELATSDITMIGYAHVTSMSGIIFQSAPLRLMMPDCYFMMHFGAASGSVIHPIALKNIAAEEIKWCDRMLEVFARRAVKGPFFKKKKSTTIKSAMAFFDAKLKSEVDWYLDAEETVYYGLADGVIGSTKYPNLSSLRKFETVLK